MKLKDCLTENVKKDGNYVSITYEIPTGGGNYTKHTSSLGWTDDKKTDESFVEVVGGIPHNARFDISDLIDAVAMIKNLSGKRK